LTPIEQSSLATEWRAVGEWAQLLADPLYWGVGVPRGRGRLVLVIPGLFGNDLYLGTLRAWLGRIGHHPVRSTISINAGCYERLSREAEAPLQAQMQARPGRVAVLGHSRGGMLARAIAARLGDQAAHLVLLGSPVGAFARMSQQEFDRGEMPPAAQPVVDASLRARRLLDPDCRFPACGCPFPADLRRPLSPQTRTLSVYSRNDAVVPPAASPVPDGRNVEVGGTHSGLVYNRAVYREVAALLATE
jgi:triacylglycerol lipase